MSSIVPFLECAHKEGFSATTARRTYRTIQLKLERVGYAAQTTFYIYRTGHKPEGSEFESESESESGAGSSSKRPRWLLVFSSPDDALAFAQRKHLKPTPRLLPVQLVQLLMAMLQHPAINALIFTEEYATVSPETHIPTLLHLNRTELIDMLKGYE
jgi:hypothetical protein